MVSAEIAVLGAEHEFILFAQEDGNVIDPKSFLNQETHGIEQVLDFENDGGYLSDGVDDFQLLRTAALERIQASVLQGHRRLSREEREQVDNLVDEVVKVFALAIEHADDFFAHHQGYGDSDRVVRAGTDVARIFVTSGA